MLCSVPDRCVSLLRQQGALVSFLCRQLLTFFFSQNNMVGGKKLYGREKERGMRNPVNYTIVCVCVGRCVLSIWLSEEKVCVCERTKNKTLRAKREREREREGKGRQR